MEKYGLAYNEWFTLLYQDRSYWVPAFVNHRFWAGLSPTRPGENMESFFDGHIESETRNFFKFLEEYEMAMESKYETEALAEFESFHKSPPLFSLFYMEGQLSGLYTIDVFVKFQDELKALVYCHPSLIKKDGLPYMFEFKELTRVKEDKIMEQKNYEVVFSASDREVQCICHYFQFRGLLRRDALSVLNLQNVDEIPSRYILECWKKNFKGVHAAGCLPYEIVANGPMEHFENLHKHCTKLAEIGATSDDKYGITLKIVNSALEKLLEDNFTYRGEQVKIVTVEQMTDRIIDDNTAAVGTMNMHSKNREAHNLMDARKKGRKKRKESMVEETLDINKEKVQVNETSRPVSFHSSVPLSYQHPIANPSWSPGAFST